MRDWYTQDSHQGVLILLAGLDCTTNPYAEMSCASMIVHLPADHQNLDRAHYRLVPPQQCLSITHLMSKRARQS